MAPRNRKKDGGGGRKDDPSTDSKNTGTDAYHKGKKQLRKPTYKKKKDKPALWIWASVIVGITSVGWLFFYAANLGNDAIGNGDVNSFLSSFVCQDPNGGYCHDALVPHRRTQKATRFITSGETVLVVPRHLQIWDLDALRDGFVKEHLLSARHAYTDNPLDSGAYLAAYLARRMYHHDNSTLSEQEEDPLQAYLDILPTYKTLEAFHPALWSERRLANLLGPNSLSYAVAKAYQDMIQSEYNAFSSVSSEFASQISEDMYKTMRVHVMSRSFGPGPPGPEESSPNVSLESELELYQVTVGVDLKKGCRAMVPMLDMYDHHPSPNVNWKYNGRERAFVVTAAPGGIQAGHEIMDSYGTYTDSHLFAKFGFVNGDGSGFTEASIASFHKPLDVGLKQQFSYIPLSRVTNETIRMKQKALMSNYLAFDDGYKECIQKELHPEAFELKQLKLEHLMRIANIPSRWILRVHPRTPKAVPAVSTDIPITNEPPKFDLNNLKVDASKIITTCRLASLTNDDFGGKAVAVLKNALEETEAPITIDKQGDSLEYRALSCLARLSGLAYWRFNDEEEYLRAIVRELTNTAYQSRKWTTAHVRLGEIQTLDMINKLGISGVNEMTGRIRARLDSESFGMLPIVREKQCPVEYTIALYEDELK